MPEPNDREAVSIFQKINRYTGKAIIDYRLIREGDRVVVAVSGGKDSLLLLHTLALFQKKAPVRFELLAVHISQDPRDRSGATTIEQFATQRNIPCRIEYEQILDIVDARIKAGDTRCALCSRLRRGSLYRVAREEGASAIALGHHRDDLIETFLMNLLFSGKLGTMSPHYRVREGDLRVIRPFALVHEQWIREYVIYQGWIPVTCESCEKIQGELKRNEMSALIEELDQRYPQSSNSIFKALANPHIEELLAASLWSGDGFSIPGWWE